MNYRLMIVFRRLVRRLDRLDKLKQTDKPTLKHSCCRFLKPWCLCGVICRGRLVGVSVLLREDLNRLRLGMLRVIQLETRLLQCRVLVMFLVSSILGMVTVLSIESGAQYADMIVDMVHLVTLHVVGMSVVKGMY